jgi:hypothetical protein
LSDSLALRSRRRASLAGGAALVALAGCAGVGPVSSPGRPSAVTSAVTSQPSGGGAAPSATSGATSAVVPRPVHTVVVVMENHSYADIIGNSAAPFINRLARSGALFTRSYAVTHPSEPNYLALFSGSTQAVPDDSCPHTFTVPNLAAGLIAAGMSFAGYSEDLPAAGSPVCAQGNYARKHVPWTDFSNVPGSVSKPFTSWPAGDFTQLPTVSYVIPNLCNDMHDCSVATGDAWLRAHIGGYANWAMSHDSLLIITWDEDDGSTGNQIPTIFAGQLVSPGQYSQSITHYSVLATIEAAYGLPRDGQAATARPITSVWTR